MASPPSQARPPRHATRRPFTPDWKRLLWLVRSHDGRLFLIGYIGFLVGVMLDIAVPRTAPLTLRLASPACLSCAAFAWLIFVVQGIWQLIRRWWAALWLSLAAVIAWAYWTLFALSLVLDSGVNGWWSALAGKSMAAALVLAALGIPIAAIAAALDS